MCYSYMELQFRTLNLKVIYVLIALGLNMNSKIKTHQISGRI